MKEYFGWLQKWLGEKALEVKDYWTLKMYEIEPKYYIDIGMGITGLFHQKSKNPGKELWTES
jgi:hypothetical protein